MGADERVAGWGGGGGGAELERSLQEKPQVLPFDFAQGRLIGRERTPPVLRMTISKRVGLLINADYFAS